MNQDGTTHWPVELRLKKAEKLLEVVFDDGHSTGIYSWAYLRTLGAEQETRWRNYLAAVQSQGLSRE